MTIDDFFDLASCYPEGMGASRLEAAMEYPSCLVLMRESTMHKRIFIYVYSAAVLTGVALPSAQAQSPTIQDMTGSNACMQAVNFPKPFGESDLKGNSKLPAYCDCYMAKFQARAEKAAASMQADPGKAPRKTRAESNAEQLAMRNSCRKQLGLPLAPDPGK